MGNLLQFQRKLRTFFDHRRWISNGAIKELRGSIEQLADAQVDQKVLAGDAVCDVIRGVAVWSVSKLVLTGFQRVLPRMVGLDQ